MTQLVLNAQTPTSKANAVTIMPDESLVFRQEHHNRKYGNWSFRPITISAHDNIGL